MKFRFIYYFFSKLRCSRCKNDSIPFIILEIALENLLLTEWFRKISYNGYR